MTTEYAPEYAPWQWLIQGGADLNAEPFILLDDEGLFAAQTETIEEAFTIADERGIRCPGIFNLDIIRKNDGIYDIY